MGLTITETSQFFVDDRDAGRVLRVHWHPEHRIAVLSVWNGLACVATFRLRAADVPGLAYTLNNGLAELATAASTSSYRDAVAATLLSDQSATPAAAEPPRGRGRWTRYASRRLDALIERCARLRDRLDRH